MRFTGSNGEHYELNIAPLIKNTFIDNTIALTNKDTGVVERFNFGAFKSLTLDKDYKYIMGFFRFYLSMIITLERLSIIQYSMKSILSVFLIRMFTVSERHS